MTRGRKPKPTHLKVITGNPGKRPLKPDAVQPPIPEAAIEPPAHLSAEAKVEWMRIAPTMKVLGILSDLDRAPFAAYCDAYGRWERAERLLAQLAEQDKTGRGAMLVKTKSGNVIPNPLVWMSRNAANDMVRYAAEFGFTPSTRSRISAVPQRTGGKFEGLIGRRYFD